MYVRTWNFWVFTIMNQNNKMMIEHLFPVYLLIKRDDIFLIGVSSS
jgi:hypothetical protein